MNSPLKIGHRGAKGYEPENTLRSFERAATLEVDAIELDVHRCKSGEIVVMHDATIERTTNGTGPIAAKTFQELRQLDAGGGEKIPTFEEVLELINRRVHVHIELKGSGTALPVSKTIERYVEAHGWQYGDFLVSSFNHRQLQLFHRLCPAVRIGALYRHRPYRLKKIAKTLGAYSVNLPYGVVNQKLVEEIHAAGLRVMVYTVNEPRDIARMKSYGVDGLHSDYPDRLEG